MEWNRMIDRLPPFDKQFLLSVPWKDGFSHEYTQKKSEFCPNCGADMMGGNAE